MKIGIDISQIVYPGTGVSRYLKGLVHAITKYEHKHAWFFFFSSLRNSLDPETEKIIRNSSHRLFTYPLPSRLLSVLWNDLHRIPVARFVGDVDWFITSDWTEPPSNTKKATVIHDLIFLQYPETVDRKILETQKKRIRWVQDESDLIFCDSIATKQDVVKFLHISEDKLETVYPGVMVMEPSKTDISRTLLKYDLNRPFILTVGKIEPRKNIKRLINAFRSSDIMKKDIHLVIVGPRGWEKLTLDTQDGKIRMLGLVNDVELFSLYASCLFFAYPSLYEGFGYPILEAMKMGAPVATSNLSSLKELGEGSALLFNPMDTSDMTRVLQTLASDEDLRKSLREKGLEKSKSFTWKNCYSHIITSLEKQNI